MVIFDLGYKLINYISFYKKHLSIKKHVVSPGLCYIVNTAGAFLNIFFRLRGLTR